MVAAQQLLQVGAAGCMAHVRVTHRATGGEGPGNLIVEFNPVGDDDKRPISRHLSQDLLGEENHRETLAAALRLPEHAAATVPRLASLERGSKRIVNAE